jgi:hypothetical protein
LLVTLLSLLTVLFLVVRATAAAAARELMLLSSCQLLRGISRAVNCRDFKFGMPSKGMLIINGLFKLLALNCRVVIR